MEQNDLSLRLEVSQTSPAFCAATIFVPDAVVKKSRQEAVKAQQKSARPYGFHKADVPLEYIRQNFEINIDQHLQEFLFKYFVLSFLYQQLREQKLNCAGDPRLTSIIAKPGQDAEFHFDISLFPKIEFQHWKYYPKLQTLKSETKA